MTVVNSLVDIAAFGIVGAIMMAALIGLLLVVAGRRASTAPSVRVAFGAASVVLLVALPALTAANVLGRTGLLLPAFLSATAVAVLVYAVNIALLPVVARRQAAVLGEGRLARIKPSPATLLGGLAVCAALGLLAVAIAALFA